MNQDHRAKSIAHVNAIKTMLVGLQNPDGSKPELEQHRAGYDAWGQAFPLPDGGSWTDIVLNGVRAEEIHVPLSQPSQALLYLHGGGYGIGSPRSHRHLVGQFCAAAGLVGYALEYRLAPETVFPGAVDDALAAYRALLDRDYSPDKIIIAGDSAGGGLTIACGLAIKAAGLPQPAGYFAISPWANLTQSGPSYAAKGDVDFIVTQQDLNAWADLYVAGGDIKDPLASPVFGDFQNLAPILIHVGSEEVLLSDSIELAQRAGLAKVEVTLKIAPEMPHVWHYMWAQLDDARAAISEAGDWMKAHLA